MLRLIYINTFKINLNILIQIKEEHLNVMLFSTSYLEVR